MTALLEILEHRSTTALRRADDLAAHLDSVDSRDVQTQLDLELALDDAERYARLRDRLAPSERLGGGGGPYTRNSPHSVLRDLMNEKSGDPETRSRLSAQRRDTVRKEQRSGMAGFAGLVVPQYLLDDAATSVKPLRPLLDWIGTKPIPESGGTVELSRYTTGAVGSAQVADNTALTQVDPVAAALSVPVRTPNVSIKTSWQVLDRLSVASQAEIILEMMEALATIVDTFVVSGSGVSGQPTGLATQAGSTSVTYVSGTPTVAALMLKLGALATQTSLARKRPVDTFVMHSRRWFWIVANVDAAVSHQVGPGQTLFGLPVIIDDNITTTGGGGNEDVVIAFRASDLRIYESEPHVFVDTQSGAGTGSANLIVYQYLAVAAGRYPAGIGLLTGTGLGGAVLS